MIVQLTIVEDLMKKANSRIQESKFNEGAGTPPPQFLTQILPLRPPLSLFSHFSKGSQDQNILPFHFPEFFSPNISYTKTANFQISIDANQTPNENWHIYAF